MASRFSALLTVVVVGLLSVASELTAAAQEAPDAAQEEFLQDLKRIDGPVGARDLSALESLADELENKWSLRDSERYGEMVLKLCRTFSSYSFKGERQYQRSRRHELSRRYAKLALDKSDKLSESDKIPLKTELWLLLHLHPVRPVAEYKRLAREGNWSDKRSDMAEYYIRAWRRLEEAIDPNWKRDDPSHRVSFPMPPAGVGLAVSGMSPDSIQDPNLRAEYVAAIKEYTRKARAWTRQARLRSLRDDVLHRVQRHLVRLYSGPAFDSKQLEDDALRQDIAKHVTDPRIRAIILKGVQDRLVEDLKPKPATPSGRRGRVMRRQPK